MKPLSAAVNANLRGRRERDISKNAQDLKTSYFEENTMIKSIQFRHFIKIQSFCRAKYEDFLLKSRLPHL